MLHLFRRKDVGAAETGSLVLAVNQALARVRFGPLNDEDIAYRANKIVRRELDKSAITYNEYKKWRAVNPFVFTSVVDEDNTLIGFFDVFPLKTAAGEALLKGSLTERSLASEHLVPRREVGNTTHVHIATILLNRKQRTFHPIVGREVLLLKLKQFFQEHYEPLEDRTFTAYAQTRAGAALLKRCGFSVAIVAEKNKDRWPLYVLPAGAARAAAFRFERADAHLAARAWVEEWDPRIHQIERTLRKLIASALNNDIKLLPSNVAERIDQRLTPMMKRNPAMNGRLFDQMLTRLEYCDLRELQATILNKALWSRFDNIFRNQELLYSKFGQLSDLRNAIRHSRSINQIVLREGEAAILWFETVLEFEA